MINNFLRKYKQRDFFTKNERDSIILSFYDKLPISNKYLKSTVKCCFYITYYYNFLAYKKFNLQSIEPLLEKKEFVINGKRYIIENECAEFLYIKNKNFKEDLWALYMLGLMKLTPVGTFNETIDQFKEIFPMSKWNKMLDKQARDIGDTQEITYVLQSPIKYIDTSKKIETLQELLSDMPNGKPVLIDIWASWCAPCIKSFQYNKQLDTFLIANNIERLYLSLDYKGGKQNWKSTIEKYALGGYHLMPENALIEDIKKNCNAPIADGLVIPRYMLITKDKKIALNNAMEPANIHILKEQIFKYILH